MLKEKDDFKEKVFQLFQENASYLLKFLVQNGVPLPELAARLEMDVQTVWLLLNYKQLPREAEQRIWHFLDELYHEKLDKEAGLKRFKKKLLMTKNPKAPIRSGTGAFHKNSRLNTCYYPKAR